MWSLLEEVLDWLLDYRFKLCFWGGLVLGIVVVASIPQKPWNLMIGGAVCDFLWIVGWRWDRQRHE